jgi:hypothetical protein
MGPAVSARLLAVVPADDPVRGALLRRGFALEYVTLGWKVAGIVILAIAAAAARSVALAGFGLDSLIEIGASTVVIWELAGTGEERQRRGLRLIGSAFAALAVYLLVQSTAVLAAGYHPRHSVPGIIWTAVTAAAMFALAAGKARAGQALDNPVLRTEGPGHDDRRDPGRRGAAEPGAECRARLVVGRSRRRVRAGVLRSPRGTGDLLGRSLTETPAGHPGETGRPHQRVAYRLQVRRRRCAGAGWWHVRCPSAGRGLAGGAASA